MSITITTTDWNKILQDNPKSNIQDFLSLFHKISPKHKFIKNSKSIFTKNSKNVITLNNIPDLTLGVDFTLDKIFFLSNNKLILSFIDILENKKVPYWDEFLIYLENHKIFIPGYLSMFEYALFNIDFFNKHEVQIIQSFAKISRKMITDKASLQDVEKMIELLVGSFKKGLFDSQHNLEILSSLLHTIPHKSIVHYIKEIHNSQYMIDLDLHSDKIHPLIKQKLTNHKSHEMFEDSAIHFQLDINKFSLKYNKNINNLNFIVFIFLEFFSKENKNSVCYFYETRFANNDLIINYFAKENKQHIKNKNLIEKLLWLLQQDSIEKNEILAQLDSTVLNLSISDELLKNNSKNSLKF